MGLSAIDSAKRGEITLADFFEAGQSELGLTLEAGRSCLNHLIEEPSGNRPGLALTGFYECFAWRRLQIFGYPEMQYLNSLDDATRIERLRALVDHGAYWFVMTNGQRPHDNIREQAEQAGVVVMSTTLKTGEFARRSVFLLEKLMAPRTAIYGTMVEVSGLGVLIEGASGLGKSETALGLLKRGAALVADDLTHVRKEFAQDVLYGSAEESTSGFMEIRGIGIMDVSRIFGINAVRGEKRLQLLITFMPIDEIADEIDRVGRNVKMKRILGVDVPNVIIPVSEGRDLVNLVETAVQQQKLLHTGYDPVSELSQRLHRRAKLALAESDGDKHFN